MRFPMNKLSFILTFALVCSLFAGKVYAFSESEAKKQVQQEEFEIYQKKVADWKAQHKNDKESVSSRLGENVRIFPLSYAFRPSSLAMEASGDERRYKQYPDPILRLVDNVKVRDQSENQISYIYNDARIDELAFLAAEYCYNQEKKTALLQKITLYQNRARLATFDCLSL